MKRQLVKKGLLLLIVAVAMLVSYTLVAQEKRDTLKLTLDDALQIALSENLTIQVADKEITRQEYAKKGTYASLFPQIDFSGNYQRTVEKQMMYMDGVPGMGGTGFKVGRDNTWSAGFSASMPIISVPLWKSLKISAYDVELAVEKARSSRIDMVDQVKRAYYGVLLANDAYEVYKNAYDNAVSNYNEIKNKYDKGLQAEYDLIRAEVNVSNAEPTMYDAENSLLLAHWQLKALLGLDLEMDIACLGVLADYEPELVVSSSFIMDTISLDNNSTLKQLDIQYEQLKKVKSSQLAQYYPSLNAQFSYMWNSMNNDFKFKDYNWDPYSVLGISLSIPIFSGGKKASDVKKTKMSMEQLSIQKTDTERNLTVAVKQATSQMGTCVKQYNAARAGVEQSEKGYTITMKRYETGEGTLLDINDSQLSMNVARLNLNQSIYNYLAAKSSLEKILGDYEQNNE
jgi:outer membrane protein TolC